MCGKLPAAGGVRPRARRLPYSILPPVAACDYEDDGAQHGGASAPARSRALSGSPRNQPTNIPKTLPRAGGPESGW